MNVRIVLCQLGEVTMQLHKLIWKIPREESYTQKDFYTFKGLRSAVSNRYSGLKRDSDEYEVVTYELVEVNRQSLEEFMQESSKG